MTKLMERLPRALAPAQFITSVVVVALGIGAGTLSPPPSESEITLAVTLDPSSAVFAPDDTEWVVEDMDLATRISLAIAPLVLALPRPVRVALPAIFVAFAIAVTGALLLLPRLRRASTRTRALVCAAGAGTGWLTAVLVFTPGGYWIVPAMTLALLLAISFSIGFAIALLIQRK